MKKKKKTLSFALVQMKRLTCIAFIWFTKEVEGSKRFRGLVSLVAKSETNTRDFCSIEVFSVRWEQLKRYLEVLGGILEGVAQRNRIHRSCV